MQRVAPSVIARCSKVEAGAARTAVHLASELRPLALRLGSGGSEEAFAGAVLALACLSAGVPGAAAQVDAAVARLDQIDARYLMPEVLNVSAQMEYARDHQARAVRKQSSRSRWRSRWTGHSKLGGHTPFWPVWRPRIVPRECHRPHRRCTKSGQQTS